ncbi:MAG: hypothetical protein U0744_15995 [Gemmataceae bacterium]
MRTTSNDRPRRKRVEEDDDADDEDDRPKSKKKKKAKSGGGKGLMIGLIIGGACCSAAAGLPVLSPRQQQPAGHVCPRPHANSHRIHLGRPHVVAFHDDAATARDPRHAGHDDSALFSINGTYKIKGTMVEINIPEEEVNRAVEEMKQGLLPAIRGFVNPRQMGYHAPHQRRAFPPRRRHASPRRYADAASEMSHSEDGGRGLARCPSTRGMNFFKSNLTNCSSRSTISVPAIVTTSSTAAALLDAFHEVGDAEGRERAAHALQRERSSSISSDESVRARSGCVRARSSNRLHRDLVTAPPASAPTCVAATSPGKAAIAAHAPTGPSA